MLRLFFKLDTKVAYLPMHKVASTSITRTFLESVEIRKKLEQDDGALAIGPKVPMRGDLIYSSVFRMKGKEEKYIYNLANIKGVDFYPNRGWELSGYEAGKGFTREPISAEKVNRYFIFTFVRNPFRRLTSCFQEKFSYDESIKKLTAFTHVDRYALCVEDFADFIRQIYAIPDERADIHYASQYYKIDIFAQKGIHLDLASKVEDLVTEFEPIRKKYKLLPLEVKNKSTDKAQHKKWQDYYTPELAKLVYERYRDDFKEFGYEAEYLKLLTYLNAPLPWRWRKRKLLSKLGVKRYKNMFADIPKEEKI